QIGIESRAVIELHPGRLYPGERAAEMEHLPMLFLQRAHEIAERRTQHALHRPRLGRDDMNLAAALTQSSRRFETDEARADDDRAAPRLRGGDDAAGVAQRAQRPHVRQLRTRHLEA